MLKRTIHIANSTLVFWLLVLPLAVMAWLPGTFWFETRSLTVSDAVYGEAPTVLENRAIKRPFLGGYDTITYDAKTNLPTLCRGSERFRYGNILDGVRSMGLVQWTANEAACQSLPVGTYYMRVCRIIEKPFPRLHWLVGPKDSCATSNLFRINEQ